MREVIAYIGNLKVVATDLLGSLSPVTGAFLFSREAFLPFNLALQCLLEVCLLFRRIIKGSSIGRDDRRHNIPIETYGDIHKLFFRQMLQISKQFSFGGKNCRFVVRKGDVPLASMNRDVDRGRHLIIQVDVDPDRTYRVLLGARSIIAVWGSTE